MGFFSKALRFVHEAAAQSGFSRNSVSRPVTFTDLTYDEVKSEADEKIGAMTFLVKQEAGGNWEAVGLIRKLSSHVIHFSPAQGGSCTPDVVEVTRNHTGKLVARAKYDNSVHIEVR